MNENDVLPSACIHFDNPFSTGLPGPGRDVAGCREEQRVAIPVARISREHLVDHFLGRVGPADDVVEVGSALVEAVEPMARSRRREA
ncbi:hypothetical protein ACL02T_24935 [Pseudonocardia sp. RS010]|uniref:hypothetical protein n=1 Tax=Pseudonocardia sp. RS010 TaxID=3385979 RepID=UPI00399FD1E8